MSKMAVSKILLTDIIRVLSLLVLHYLLWGNAKTNTADPPGQPAASGHVLGIELTNIDPNPEGTAMY